jgi:nucleoside 2-deoxyribosyltransferase
MKNTVYIAGPMEGLSQSEMTGWRKEFTELANDLHVVDVKDPTRRIPFRSDDTINQARMVFRADLMDINNSAVVFLDLRKGKGYAWGTAMEAMYAWQANKPLIIWTNQEDPRHPFIESMATAVVHSLQDGVEKVIALIEPPKREVPDSGSAAEAVAAISPSFWPSLYHTKVQ